MRKTYLLMLFTFLLATTSWAQPSGKISGAVKEEGGKGLPSATVSLLKATDSALVKAAVTDKSGLYEFSNIKEGRYLIAYSSVGFTKSFSAPFTHTTDKATEMPAVTLSASSSSLAGVTVQAKRPFIESKIDKTVVNVEASPTNAGASALEVLEKSPGVMVNSDGAISLRGKQGVIIMVDGKPTYLSAADLTNLLKNMPASALDQIEIMTNPSSKYDASGNSGIINIKTKKGKTAGFNGSISVGATVSIFKPEESVYLKPRSQNSLNFNYRKNKINFFGNYNPNYFRGGNQQEIRRNIYNPTTGALSTYSDQTLRFAFGSENQTLKLGMDFFADKKNTFGIVASGFIFDGHPVPVTNTFIRDINGQVKSGMRSHTENNISFQNFTGNLNWRHQFDSAGRELTADFDYVTYHTSRNMLLETVPSDKNGQAGTPIYLRGDLPSQIDIVSFKADYVQPYKGGRVEAGVKSSFVKNDNLVMYQSKINNQWHEDSRSNHFLYDENINAAYVNVNRQLGKWTLQGGMRVENTLANGNQVTSKESFKRDTTNFFPTAFVSYELNKKHKATLSYSKRITRPSYQNLNPFIFFADSLIFQKGNPLLRPQFTHNIELSHALNNKFITTFAYNNTTDVISQIIRPADVTNKPEDSLKMFNTFDNVAKLNNISLSLTIPIKVTKWWNANVFTTIFNNHYTGIYNTTKIDVSTTSFMASLTNNFTLGKGLTGEVSGFYRHKGIDQLTMLESFYQMSLGVSKQIIKEKGTIRLNVRDPFAWHQFKGFTRYDDIDMTFLNRQDSRQVTATFTYRFGKTNPQNTPRRRTSSSQDEQNRVGQGG